MEDLSPSDQVRVLPATALALSEQNNSERARTFLLMAILKKTSNQLILLSVLLFLLLVTQVASIRPLFRFGALGIWEFLGSVLTGVVVFAIINVWNGLEKRRLKGDH